MGIPEGRGILWGDLGEGENHGVCRVLPGSLPSKGGQLPVSPGECRGNTHAGSGSLLPPSVRSRLWDGSGALERFLLTHHCASPAHSIRTNHPAEGRQFPEGAVTAPAVSGVG